MGGIWDKNTINHAAKCETKCDEYFNFLVAKTKYFNTIYKNEVNSIIDYRFIDSNNKNGVAELKIRNISAFAYKDIMIEEDKLNELKKYQNDGVEALYINWFCDDKKNVWICKIKDIINDDLRFSYNVRIKNNTLGEKYTYTGSRYYIPLSKGIYFEYNEEKNKFIRK